MWMVGSSNLLCTRGLERSTLRRVQLPWSTVAKAIIQSVSRSVLPRPNRLMDLLTCSMEATCMPPLCPSLQPSRLRAVTVELNWREGTMLKSKDFDYP